MPALNAAQTAFTWPGVKETSAISTFRRRALSAPDNRFGQSWAAIHGGATGSHFCGIAAATPAGIKSQGPWEKACRNLS